MYSIIIFGPPGVGKGTQAKLISDKLNLFHLSTGEYLRKAIAEETELGRKAGEIVNKGHLVPDDIMIGIVKEALKDGIKENGFILDGFPRTIEQAKALDIMLKELNLNNEIILHLTADDNEIVRRLLLRGRADDLEETIRHRLTVYSKETEPVINYYKNNANVVTINGVGEVNDINKIVLEKLNALRN